MEDRKVFVGFGDVKGNEILTRAKLHKHNLSRCMQ